MQEFMDEIQGALSRLQQPNTSVENFVAKIQFLTSVGGCCVLLVRARHGPYVRVGATQSQTACRVSCSASQIQGDGWRFIMG